MTEFGNVRLHDGTSVYIQVIRGQIISIADEPVGTYINCNGWTVVPAGIDGHVHFRDEEEAHKEDWTTGSAAALYGGYTLVCDMPNKRRPNTTADRLAELLNFIGQQPIDYRLWFGATSDNFGEITFALTQPEVAGVKVYRGSSTGNLLVADNAPFWKIGETVAAFNSKSGIRKKYLATHNENEELMRKNRSAFLRSPNIADHCRIRNTEVEVTSVASTIQMQRDTGCPVYYCHISTPESLELLYSAKQEGLDIIVEVCTHHVTLADMGNDPFGKVNPPLRSHEQMFRMAELFQRDSFVDVVGSDHAPHTIIEKQDGRYDHTPSGLTGIQTTFPVLLGKIAKGELSWKRFIALTSGNHSKILGLNRGGIYKGQSAELTFVDPGERVRLTDSIIKSKCQWTPYHNMETRGAVKAVYAQGVFHKF